MNNVNMYGVNIKSGQTNMQKPSYKCLAGYSPDGVAHYVTVSKPVCENCEGRGRYWIEAGYEVWQKAGWVDCECCNGSGKGKENDE